MVPNYFKAPVILIVDDNPKNLQILGKFLAQEKYDVEFAVDGETALEWINNKQFDLMLLDINMPGMSGFEVCKKVRSDPEMNKLPIIFLTAENGRESILKGFEMGGQDYITKPFDYRELVVRVKTHLALRKSLEKLETSNKELEAFSHSVSHDLRSPLRHIIGFAEILATQYSDALPDDASNYLNRIVTSARKMGTLIDDLLNFSKIGHEELNKSSFNMNRIVNDVLKQIESSLAGRKINWSISSLPEVHGDYSLLRQVWYNLIDNAVKYTSTREIADIRIGCIEEKGEWIFSIQDNGVGFNMKNSHKLFVVFQRLHTSSQFEGTGIGLANVHKIILRHGGSTWAEAETDKGATFYFSLIKPT